MLATQRRSRLDQRLLRALRLGGQMTRTPYRSSHLRWLSSPSKPLSSTYGPEAADPTLRSPGLGRTLRAKKVSANGWSLVEAEAKPNPVITPVGSTARSRRKPSYHPRLLDHPMSACPASHPSPLRFASRTGMAEVSKAS